jgi:hypothetical protein
MPVEVHQLIQPCAFSFTQMSFPMASQKVRQLLLLHGLHLQITKGKNLIVRQKLHRRLGHSSINPFDQDVFQATLCVGSNLSGPLRGRLGNFLMLTDFVVTAPEGRHVYSSR